VPTSSTVESRVYYLGDFQDGVAQRVRAERSDHVAWTRSLETIYWWPAREGKEWPAAVVPIPEWTGIGEEPDAWSHFETAVGIDDRYRWEPLPPESLGASVRLGRLVCLRPSPAWCLRAACDSSGDWPLCVPSE
jgi:hypothetical protein